MGVAAQAAASGTPWPAVLLLQPLADKVQLRVAAAAASYPPSQQRKGPVRVTQDLTVWKQRSYKSSLPHPPLPLKLKLPKRRRSTAPVVMGVASRLHQLGSINCTSCS